MTSLRLPRPSASGRRPRRRAALATGLVGVLALGGAAAATANAHKTVVLDVDGRTTDVSTFAGTVGSVLDAHGVEVGERDVVAPSLDAALGEGSEIVVRHARPVTVLSEGTEEQVWTTALAADEALAGLSARGSDVRLLASRSLDSGRADLSLRLTGDDPVDVVVDGQTLHVEDGAQSLESLLAELDVTVGPLDRVQVHRAPVEGGADGASRLTVVVQRVAAQEVPTVTEVPFEQVTEQTADLYTGERATAVAGVAGERTAVHRVVTVDGVEESRMLLSDGVTREPVTEVVRVGTKARPAPKPAPKPAAAPAPAQRATGGGSSSGGSSGGGGGVVTGDVWARLAACESGGNPSIVSSNGLYHGLYQFSVATWRAVGGSGLPSQASPAEQTQRAQILQARSGWGQWPACSRKLGLR